MSMSCGRSDISACDFEGRTSLHAAALSGRADIVSMHLAAFEHKEFGIDLQSKSGYTGLSASCVTFQHQSDLVQI